MSALQMNHTVTCKQQGFPLAQVLHMYVYMQTDKWCGYNLFLYRNYLLSHISSTYMDSKHSTGTYGLLGIG